MSRVVTALALIPAVCWVIFAAPFAVFWLVVAALALLCYREFSRLAARHGLLTMPLAGGVVGLLWLAQLGRNMAYLPVLAAMAGLALALRAEDLRQSLGSGAAFVLGIFYIFGAWSTALDLRAENVHWLFFAVALNWVGDISAFYAGRAFGRHKLAPRVSPAKSWEGAIASTLASLVLGVLYLGWALPEVPLWLRLLAAAGGNIAGQIGDLAESALKRGAGVKDSGHMLPGHGGWLDRLDSTLFSMPVVAAIRSLATQT